MELQILIEIHPMASLALSRGAWMFGGFFWKIGMSGSIHKADKHSRWAEKGERGGTVGVLCINCMMISKQI